MMKKTILLLVLLFTVTYAFCQETEWSGWASISCYKGFQASVRKLGYVKTVNQYAHRARIKNNYRQKVSFDLFWTVAGERLSIGRVTLNPNDVYEHTSRYFSKDASMMFVEVDKVSFGDKLNCYASCDNGTPNQPNCDTKIATTQGQAGTTTANTHNTAGGLGSTASSYPVQTQTTQTNAANTQRQQEIIRQQQELQRQQNLQQGVTQVTTSITDIISSIQANKEADKERRRQEALAQSLADQQEALDADNGEFKPQISVAEKYFEKSKYNMAEYYYNLALRNNKATQDTRNSYLDKYITTLALQGKKKEVSDVFRYMKDNHIHNFYANLAYCLLEANCDDFPLDGVACSDNTRAAGFRKLLELSKDTPWAKDYIYYMSVTGDSEKYGHPKDKDFGMKGLELSAKEYPKDCALYYLGMIYLNGTADIKKDEDKAFKYFLKATGYNDKAKDLILVPHFPHYVSTAYFNYTLLSYIKMAVIYSRRTDKDDMATAATMRARLVKWYPDMIPNSDKQFFPELGQSQAGNGGASQQSTVQTSVGDNADAQHKLEEAKSLEKNQQYLQAANAYQQYFDKWHAGTLMDHFHQGVAYYKAFASAPTGTTPNKMLLLKADSVFSYVNQKATTPLAEIVLYRAYVADLQDADRNNIKGLAMPFYQQYISMMIDKTFLTESEKIKMGSAYVYTAQIYQYRDKNMAKAREAYTKAKEYDPANKYVVAYFVSNP